MNEKKIIRGIRFFDEEQQQPSDYVVATDDGRFEAIVCHFDTLKVIGGKDKVARPSHGVVREYSLGFFETEEEAITAVWDHLERHEHHYDWESDDDFKQWLASQQQIETGD